MKGYPRRGRPSGTLTSPNPRVPNFVFQDIFSELVLLLPVAVIAGVVSLRLKQPLIIGFIAVGILDLKQA